MILTKETIDYFRGIAARLNQTAVSGDRYPYLIEGDDFFKKYESIRMVGSIMFPLMMPVHNLRFQDRPTMRVKDIF